jgi:hypothetical protein
MMKLLLIALLLPKIAMAQYGTAVVKYLPIDSATGKAAFSQIFNVYNRDQHSVLRYAINYCKAQNLPYQVDSTSGIVSSTCSFYIQMSRNDCIQDVKITGKMNLYAKLARTRIEFTDLHYRGLTTSCPSEGSIEDLAKCEACRRFYPFFSAVHEQCNRVCGDYHDHLKKSVRAKDDW